MDRNVSRFLARTGLVLHGYGQYGFENEFGTSPSENYEFLKRLVLDFSKQTGWSPGTAVGYSPKELDYIFWLFSNKTGICKGKPECYHCPIKEFCVTSRNWKGTPTKSPSEVKADKKEEKRVISQWIREHPKEVEELKKRISSSTQNNNKLIL